MSMQYKPTFDQEMCLDLGLSPQDGMLLNMITAAAGWAQQIDIDNESYYFLAHDKIMEELPCVFKSKPTVSRSVKNIERFAIVIKHQRMNYYKLHPIILKYWGKTKNTDEYIDFINNEKDPSTVSKMKQHRFKNETILCTTVSKMKPIKKLYQITNNPKREKSSRFSPPSVQEVSDYCLQRSNGINADSFINFYESKGWMVGKNKMKSWQAAIRTWEQRDNRNNGKGTDGFGNKLIDLTSTNW